MGKTKQETESKGKYWWAIMYPENMVDNWENNISEIIQKPFAYCIHDKDLAKEDREEERKKHVHIIIAWKNNTTYNSALSVFKRLNAPGKQAIAFGGVIEKCEEIDWSYNYLIHDSDDARKKGKFQYSKEERITGNNFDIGCFVQISKHDKNTMIKELCNVIIDNGITNYVDFYTVVVGNYDDSYFEILTTNTTVFRELIKGNFHKKLRE